MSAHERGRKPTLHPDAEALTKAPPAPRHLDGHAQAEWRRVMPGLCARGIITRLDLGGLEDLCTMRGIVRRIEEERIERGGTIDPKQFGVQHRAMQAARQLASEFGLSPTSRARLGAHVSDEDDDDNPLAV